MYRKNRFVFTILQFVLLIDCTKQSRVKQAITTVKAISKTIKSPIIKTFSNTMKNSASMFRQNKNTIKNLAYGFQEKYLKTSHNFGNKSIKYLREGVIKNFKYTAPQAARGGNQLVRESGKQNIQMRSAKYMLGNDFGSLLNMVIKSKPQLPFLVGGGLVSLTQSNLMCHPESKFFVAGTYDLASQERGEVFNATKLYDLPEYCLTPKDMEDQRIAREKTKKNQINNTKASPYNYDQNIEEPAEETPLQNNSRIIIPGEKRIPKGNYYNSQMKMTYTDAVFHKRMTANTHHNKNDRLTNPEKYEDDNITKLFEKPDKYEDYRSMAELKNMLKGTLTLKNTGIYEGEIVNGKPVDKGTVTFPNKVVYEGSLKNGEANGKGKITYPNGEIYEGDFQNGIIEGTGKFTYTNGAVYEGEMSAGKGVGKGRLSYTNGEVYVGEFSGGSINGLGVMHYKNGEVYAGMFHNGIKHGKGKLEINGTCYTGEFVGGRAHGTGKLQQKDGVVYEGKFKWGTFNGKGKQSSSNGDIYEGNFVEGVRSGWGKLTKADGIIHEGNNAGNLFEGKGKLTYKNGITYEGHFTSGEYGGEGQLKYPDGTSYKGDFEYGKFAGDGTYTFKNGNVYIGEWSDSKKNGFGEFKWPNGDTYNGLWKDDNYDGEGVFYKKSTNQTQQVNWKDGKQIATEAE